MIKKFVEAWDENKGKLEEYFKATPQSEYQEYKDLVKLLFDVVINPYMGSDYYRYNTKEIVVLDDGKIVDERQNKSFHRPMYLNIDCEVMTPWVGEPELQDLPAEFKTEYVRVWQKK